MAGAAWAVVPVQAGLAWCRTPAPAPVCWCAHPGTPPPAAPPGAGGQHRGPGCLLRAAGQLHGAVRAPHLQPHGQDCAQGHRAVPGGVGSGRVRMGPCSRVPPPRLVAKPGWQPATLILLQSRACCQVTHHLAALHANLYSSCFLARTRLALPHATPCPCRADHPLPRPPAGPAVQLSDGPQALRGGRPAGRGPHPGEAVRGWAGAAQAAQDWAAWAGTAPVFLSDALVTLPWSLNWWPLASTLACRRNAAQQAAKELAEAQSEVKKIQEVGRVAPPLPALPSPAAPHCAVLVQRRPSAAVLCLS